jgi:hypothetical protein
MASSSHPDTGTGSGRVGTGAHVGETPGAGLPMSAVPPTVSCSPPSAPVSTRWGKPSKRGSYSAWVLSRT